MSGGGGSQRTPHRLVWRLSPGRTHVPDAGPRCCRGFGPRRGRLEGGGEALGGSGGCHTAFPSGSGEPRERQGGAGRLQRLEDSGSGEDLHRRGHAPPTPPCAPPFTPYPSRGRRQGLVARAPCRPRAEGEAGSGERRPSPPRERSGAGGLGLGVPVLGSHNSGSTPGPAAHLGLLGTGHPEDLLSTSRVKRK